MRRIALILGGTLTIAACTNPALGPGTQTLQSARQCFSASSISGFSDAGPDRALVRIGFQETWELTLSPGCPDVNWAMRIGIVSRGSQRICTGRPAELVVPSATGAGQRCLVSNVRRLPPQEAAAARGETPR